VDGRRATSQDVAVLSFLAAAAVLVVLPGPDSLLMLRSVVLNGRRGALRTAAGVLTGLSVWAVAAALGLSALIRASHTGYLALRVVGAAYLVTLGVQALRQRRDGERVASVRRGRGVLGTGYAAGLATDLLNPKVGVFFVTFLPAFVPRGEPVGSTSMILGALFVIETAIYFIVLITMVDRITRWMGDSRIRRRLDACSAVVLIGFGARLALES
jgi:threonine/homoserine/homoserine lactone efflux protein